MKYELGSAASAGIERPVTFMHIWNAGRKVERRRPGVEMRTIIFVSKGITAFMRAIVSARVGLGLGLGFGLGLGIGLGLGLGFGLGLWVRALG